MVCTLGNFATKLLSGNQTGITRVHGRPQRTSIGGRELYLYPIFHPAAALYTPAMLKTLKQDFLRLPELLALPLGRCRRSDGAGAAVDGSPTADAAPVEPPAGLAAAPVRRRRRADAARLPPGAPRAASAAPAGPEQLGLF